MGPPSVDAIVVFAVVAVTMVLLLSETVEPVVVGLSVLVSLVLLGDHTGIGPTEALAGFGTGATVTVAAMYVLSEAVRRTGAVDRVGAALASIGDGGEYRLLAAVTGAAGLSAALLNNTPVVAVLVPTVQEVAGRVNVSPSKLFLPLSYAAMLGGRSPCSARPRTSSSATCWPLGSGSCPDCTRSVCSR